MFAQFRKHGIRKINVSAHISNTLNSLGENSDKFSDYCPVCLQHPTQKWCAQTHDTAHIKLFIDVFALCADSQLNKHGICTFRLNSCHLQEQAFIKIQLTYC